ncbi:MAG: DUF1295 domain-containing protein [Nannocystaceae bacterium]|nr:DUF1295 domain-containing protein [bacterium]
MHDPDFHAWMTWLEIGLAAVTLLALLFINAPYGRHVRRGWGPEIPSRVGWIVMEFPAVGVFLWFYAQGVHRWDLVPLALLSLWQVHYIHRTFIFPFRLRTKGKTMPVLIAAMAIAFNVLNAYVNATWLSHFGAYDVSWLWDPRFIVGVAVFAAGFFINITSDQILINLRKPGETGYKIPKGGLFRVVSSPNYLGEIVEWTGFAIATWSLPGLAFALYTAANVGPRALANHRWYREKFENYPSERRALIPFVL